MDGNNQNFDGGQNPNNVPDNLGGQQPQMDNNQQYQQPQMDYNQQYQQPQMDYNQQYQQPQMDYNQQYQQPQMDYNQQYQQPQMDNSQPNPYSYAPSGATPNAPKKPKGKLGKIIGGIVGVGAVAGLAVAGVLIIPGLFKSERKTVEDSYEDAFSSSMYSSVIEDEIGVEGIAEKANYTSFDLTINSIMGMEDLSDLSLSYSSIMDKENKKLECDLGLSYQGDSIISANVLADENKTYVSVPELIDGFFSFNNKDFQNSLNNSYVGEIAPISGIEGDLDYFAENSNEFLEGFEALWDNAEITKGKKEKVDVDGKDVKCTVYTATITEEAIETYLADTFASSFESLDEQLSEFGGTDMDIESLITSDVVIKYYIKGSDLIKISASTAVDVEGTAADVTFDMTMLGDKNPMDKFEGKLSVSVMGTGVDINFNGETTKSGDEIVFDFTLSAGMAGMSVYDLTLTNTLDSKSLEFNGEVNAIPGSLVAAEGIPEINATYSGSYEDVKKGESYTLNVDSLELFVDSESVASLSLSMTQSTGVEEVSAMPTATYDLNTMTEADFTALATDNQDKIMTWYTNVMEMPPVAYLMDTMGDLGLEGMDGMDDIYADDDEFDFEDYDFEDYDFEDYDEEDYDFDYTVDGPGILVGEDCNVEFIGTLPGFELSYASEYSVSYMNDDYESLNYYLYSFENMDEAVAYLKDYYSYYTEEEMEILSEGLDDKSGVFYQELQFSFYGDYVEVLAIKEVSEGNYLLLSTTSSSIEDKITVEQVIDALSDQYYEVTK